MKRLIIWSLVFVSISIIAAGSVYAMYSITREGAWPKELEPLRNQSRTLTHHTVSIHEIHFINREEFESAWPHILRIKSKGAPLILLSSPYDRFGEQIQAGVRILSPLTGTLVTPEGTHYPPGAESAIPDGKFLKIGPPWPDYIKSDSGVLPEYVIYENAKWAPYTKKKQKEFEIMRKEMKKRKGKIGDDFKQYLFRRRARIDIELVVDGDIVDLNRTHLPVDTPVIDKRFKDERDK